MLTQEQSVEIKVLARQSLGIKPIARTLGVSRNTVRKYLRGEISSLRYAQRAARPEKLDPFKVYLQSRVEAARPHIGFRQLSCYVRFRHRVMQTASAASKPGSRH